MKTHSEGCNRELGTRFLHKDKGKMTNASYACVATLESLSSDKSVTSGLIQECFIETTVQIILMCLDGIFLRNVKVSDEFLLACLFFLFLF